MDAVVRTGDDMWFVIENLRAYLGSADVQAEVASGNSHHSFFNDLPKLSPLCLHVQQAMACT